MAITIEELRYAFTADTSQLDKQLNRVQSGLKSSTDQFGQGMQKSTKQWAAATQLAATTALIAISAALIRFGQDAIATYAEMDALKKGIYAVAGSADAAEEQLRRLKDVAKAPGLGYKEAIQGSIRLQAVGLTARQSEAALKSFGNALATVGGGKAELDGVILALSQIMAKGVVSAEEIRQIAERMPQVRGLMQEAFGTSDTMKIQKMGLSTESFVTGLTAAAAKLPSVGNSTKNAIENMGDAWDEFKTNLIEAVAPAITVTITKLSELLDWASKLGNGWKILAAGAGLVVGPIAMVTVSIVKLNAAYRALLDTKKAVIASSGADTLMALGVAGNGNGEANLSVELLRAKQVAGRLASVRSIKKDWQLSLNDSMNFGGLNNAYHQLTAREKIAQAGALEAKLAPQAAKLNQVAEAAKKCGIALEGAAPKNLNLWSNLVTILGNAKTKLVEFAKAAYASTAAWIAANPVLAAVVVTLGAVFLIYKKFIETKPYVSPNDGLIKKLDSERESAKSAAQALEKYIKLRERLESSPSGSKTKGLEFQVGVAEQDLKKMKETAANYKRDLLGGGNWYSRLSYSLAKTFKPEMASEAEQGYETLQDRIAKKQKEITGLHNQLTGIGQSKKDEFDKIVSSYSKQAEKAKEAGNRAGEMAANAWAEFYRAKHDAELKWGSNPKYDKDDVISSAQVKLNKALQSAGFIAEQMKATDNLAIVNAKRAIESAGLDKNVDSYRLAYIEAARVRDEAIASAMERDLETGKYKQPNKRIRDILIKQARAQFNATVRDALRADNQRKERIRFSETQAGAETALSRFNSLINDNLTGIDVSKENYADLDDKDKKGKLSGYIDYMKGRIAEVATLKESAARKAAEITRDNGMAELLDAQSRGEDITKRKIKLENEYAEAVKNATKEAISYRYQENKALLDASKDRLQAVKDEILAERDKQMARIGFTSLTGLWQENQIAGQKERFVSPENDRTAGQRQAELNELKQQTKLQQQQLNTLQKMVGELAGVRLYA